MLGLVLIVEDNEKNLKLVRDVLQATGYRTLEAGSGADARALAREHAPDVVLMDIQLSDMDGIAALQSLRADERTAAVPVLAVTAQAMSGDRERAGSCPAPRFATARTGSKSTLPALSWSASGPAPATSPS